MDRFYVPEIAIFDGLLDWKDRHREWRRNRRAEKKWCNQNGFKPRSSARESALFNPHRSSREQHYVSRRLVVDFPVQQNHFRQDYKVCDREKRVLLPFFIAQEKPQTEQPNWCRQWMSEQSLL